MIEYQGGVGAICRRPPVNKRLAVDHDHATGLIRGGLCWSCNRGLAIWNDDAERIERAATYIVSPPSIRALGKEVFGVIGKTTNKRPRKKRAKRKNGE